MLGSVPGRLAVMMFLQYFGLSAMIVPLTRYLQTPPASGGLGFAPPQGGSIYMTFPLGAALAPLLVGGLADRRFPAEKGMAGAHRLSAVLVRAGAAADGSD